MAGRALQISIGKHLLSVSFTGVSYRRDIGIINPY